MRSSAALRAGSILAAALAWAALAVQLLLSVQTTQARGGGVGLALVGFAGYFTILTNAFGALVLTAGGVRPERRGRVLAFFARPAVATTATASLLLVGIVYSLVLRQLWAPTGWQKAVDVALHDVMPFLLLAHWALAVPMRGLGWDALWRGALYPAVYLVYVLVRGALLQTDAIARYPYPFINVAEIGYARALGNAVVVTVVFLATMAALVALGRWRARRAERA